MHSKLSAEHTPSKGLIQELGVNVSLPTLSHLEANLWRLVVRLWNPPLSDLFFRVFNDMTLMVSQIHIQCLPADLPQTQQYSFSAGHFTSHRFSTKLAILTGLPGRTSYLNLPIDSLPISGGWMIRGKAKVSFSNAMFLLIFVGLPEASRIHLVHASDWPGAAHQYCKVAFEKKTKRHQLCICYTHQGSLQVSDTISNILTWKNKGNLYTFPFPGAFFLFSCPGLLTGFFDSFVLPVMVSIGPYRCVPLKVEKEVYCLNSMNYERLWKHNGFQINLNLRARPMW